MVDPYNPGVRSLLAALVAAGLLVLAFPPFRWGWLVVPALAMLFWELRAGSHPLLTGTLFGLGFYAGLIWWVGKLGLIAVAPLVVVFGLYLTLYGWLMGKVRALPPAMWWMAIVSGWVAIEAVRVRFPLGGFEWGLAGYAVAPYPSLRAAAQWVGTSGLGLVLVATAAGIVVSIERRQLRLELAGSVLVLAALSLAGAVWPSHPEGSSIQVGIVQGSTPCPLTHCFNERRATYEMHLSLTQTIEPGSVDLVIWPEGSSGGFDADPVLNPEVARSMGSEARRIGAYLIAGGDRPISDTQWINANVVFGPDGTMVGEYRKRHPVPFGEYIPARPFFEWIPELAQVPRDMIRGDGPIVFDLAIGRIGTVISFEAAFARYGRDEARNGAQLLVVASNEGSYEFTSVSDQFIDMTRMRAAELGLDVIHSAVTGKSTFITSGGEIGETAGFLEERVITAGLTLRSQKPTFYTRMGEWLQLLFMFGLPAALIQRRRMQQPPVI